MPLVQAPNTSHSPVPHKKKRADRGCSPTKVVEWAGTNGEHSTSGHLASAPPIPALLTPASLGSPSSPVLVDSPVQEDDIDLPSMLHTFEAARDLIMMTAQSPPSSISSHTGASSTKRHCGLPGQAYDDAVPITITMAPFPGTISVHSALVTGIRLLFGVRGGLLCL